jgi:magnesium transporter
MPRFTKPFSKPGTAPGTLRAPEVRRVEEASIQVMEYGPDGMEEWSAASLEAALAPRGGRAVTWIDLVGVHDVDLLRDLGDRFGLHVLSLEDVLNTGQRPKVEPYDDHLFLVMRHIHRRAEGRPGLESEQISIFFGEGFLITVQEIAGDVFEPIRERIRHGQGRIRRCGSDYLAYAILDSLVDNFFPVLEELGERLESYEEEVIDDPGRETVAGIHGAKKDLITLRRAAWPGREVVAGVERLDSPLISAETRIFLRDCYDHAVQVLDIIETYRDLATGLLDLYMSTVSNRMNEVMKVLTVLASIFIPLTFLAGIYGMNFDPEASRWNMPELQWAYGYPAFWVATLVLADCLLVYFKRKGWL